MIIRKEVISFSDYFCPKQKLATVVADPCVHPYSARLTFNRNDISNLIINKQSLNEPLWHILPLKNTLKKNPYLFAGKEKLSTFAPSF